MNNPRILEIRRGVLEKNDLLAQQLRARFNEAGVYVVNLVSSPGAGKTALLEVMLRRLRESGHPAAALVGDLATDNDAQRLARSGAPVHQIETGGNCHLEADMIAAHLAEWGIELKGLECLFIENVGNLVCPASFDLGQHANVTLLAVTEGDDKPAKYP
ncbi:MAG: hydrogenase nickel incorporation protein HypB, partial [Anaerolineae bacterium]|nr:hydrogenase nickel incorporation protein HypB [Anaerolineae bacterium]